MSFKSAVTRCCAALLCAATLGGLGASSASAASSLTLGFSSDPNLTSGTGASTPWIRRARTDGASIVRVDVLWSEVAPAHRPAGFVAWNAASRGYNWGSVDAAVRSLSAHGLNVLLTISDAPRWAEGSHRPKNAPAGTWRPDATQFAQFASAAARRYDGSFPDPNHPGTFLPRVTLWQAWNEPNLSYYFSPQWVKVHHHWKEVAPGNYRRLLNAFYTAVKRVSPSNRVLMAGTAPYGDPIGTDSLPTQRTAPVAFYRGVFCLSGRRALNPYRCSGPAHLDGLDHHPYGVGGPHWHAVNPDDVAVPDIYKIRRVLKAAIRAGHVLPHRPKSIWVSELGWSSKPPNPHGVPVGKDARWFEQAFYVLWKQGVNTVMPLEIRDPPPGPNYASVFESGLYYYNGKPKPIVKAYRFPFIIRRQGANSALAWGRAPQAGRLAIQQRRSGHWMTLRTLSVHRHQVFSTTLATGGGAALRAAIGSQSSLTWH